MSEWQPIETAPKDGTKVLLVSNRGQVYIGQYDDDRWVRKPEPYWCIAGMPKTHARAQRPTHWMPLPEPPK